MAGITAVVLVGVEINSGSVTAAAAGLTCSNERFAVHRNFHLAETGTNGIFIFFARQRDYRNIPRTPGDDLTRTAAERSLPTMSQRIGGAGFGEGLTRT